MHNCNENYDILMNLIHFMYSSIVPVSIFNSQDSNRAQKEFLSKVMEDFIYELVRYLCFKQNNKENESFF